MSLRRGPPLAFSEPGADGDEVKVPSPQTERGSGTEGDGGIRVSDAAVEKTSVLCGAHETKGAGALYVCCY